MSSRDPEMNAQVIPIRGKLEASWQEYVDAVRKHTATLNIDDGIATGRAYRRWLELFLTDDQRSKIGLSR
jgi:hypothetical protein